LTKWGPHDLRRKKTKNREREKIESHCEKRYFKAREEALTE